MIEIQNKDEVIKFLENLKEAKKTNSKTALIKAGFFIQNEVKESIAGRRSEQRSVDTGQFLNSVDVETVNDSEVKIFSDVPQALFMEYGTSKLAPRSHFTNTLSRVQESVKEIFKEEI